MCVCVSSSKQSGRRSTDKKFVDPSRLPEFALEPVEATVSVCLFFLPSHLNRQRVSPFLIVDGIFHRSI